MRQELIWWNKSPAYIQSPLPLTEVSKTHFARRTLIWMVSEWTVTKNQGQKKIAVTRRWTRKKSYRTEKRTAWKRQEPVTKKSGESGKPGLPLAFFTSWKISTCLLGPQTCVSPLEIFLSLLSSHLSKSP